MFAFAVLGGGVWVGVNTIGGTDQTGLSIQPSPTPTPAAATASPSPSPPPSPRDTPSKASPGPAEKTEASPAVSFAGTTVQVLNGTGGVTGAAERMADRLARLGFEVIAVDDALGNFSRTTVYWTSAASRPQAEALAGANGWIVEPKPDNLSTTVDVHVIVGLDEA
ncbi:MAG TPA: LytR C-terminal domain-containing protein [Actinomycetota bacterium]|nr:LytR C-terminal domain-containing protein [Actinomycetota bacterium]